MSSLASPQWQFVEDVRLARALTYSGYILLVWDYLLTLDDEMTYIWASPWSVAKYFFFGNRYLNLLMQPVNIFQVAGILPLHSNAACLTFASAMALYQFWSYGSVHFLVLLRVWVLSGCTRGTTVILTTVLALYLCASVALLVYTLGGITFNLNDASPAICGGELASFSWLIWIVEFLLEVCLFGLTIFTLNRQKSTSEFSRTSRLVRGLYRHAVIFLLANLLGDVLNTIAWTVLLKTPLYRVVNSFPVILVNITGQRLAIDLKRLHIQKEVTLSQVSRVVESELAAFEDDPLGP